MVRHQIRPGRGDEGAKLLDERERIEEQRPGPVLEGMAEAVPDPAVREKSIRTTGRESIDSPS